MHAPDVFALLLLLFFFHCREELPGQWNTDLDAFQKILVLKALRLDKVTNAMQDYVANNLGQRFIEPQVSCVCARACVCVCVCVCVCACACVCVWCV